MAWTWVDGTVVTAAQMNTQIEGRLQALESLTGSAAFKAFGAGNAATASGTYTAVQWGTPVLDTAGGWASGSPSIYTVSVPGWYACESTISFATAYTGNALLNFRINGTAQGGRTTILSAGASTSYRGGGTVTHLLHLNTGDTLDVAYFVSTTTNCALSGGSGDPSSTFEMQWAAPY